MQHTLNNNLYEKIIIRKLKKSDAAEILELATNDKYWASAISGIFSYYKKLAYVALINNNIIALAYADKGVDTLYPQFLYVKIDFRKNKIGQKLMMRLENDSKCKSSIVYYEKHLRQYYTEQGYVVGPKVEVALKCINLDDCKGQTNEKRD